MAWHGTAWGRATEREYKRRQTLYSTVSLGHCCMGGDSTFRSRLDLGSVLSASEAAMASESAQ